MERNTKKSVLVLTFVVCFFMTIGLFSWKGLNTTLENIHCKIKLEAMHSALVFYFDKNKKLPDNQAWYDLLIQEAGLSSECFTCPTLKEKEKFGTYIINQNHDLSWDTPDNMVLVFEGGPGWNQCGDFDKVLPLHQDGCHILFSNGDIKFVKKEEFIKLIWTSNEN